MFNYCSFVSYSFSRISAENDFEFHIIFPMRMWSLDHSRRINHHRQIEFRCANWRWKRHYSFNNNFNQYVLSVKHRPSEKNTQFCNNNRYINLILVHPFTWIHSKISNQIVSTVKISLWTNPNHDCYSFYSHSR